MAGVVQRQRQTRESRKRGSPATLTSQRDPPMNARRVFALCSLGCIGACWTGSDIERLPELPDIVELRVIDSTTVFMRSTGGLSRLSSEGGLVEDRKYFEAETGAVRVDPRARDPREITLTVREQASNEFGYGGSTFRLLAVTRSGIVFHHDRQLRNGTRLERKVIVPPYVLP